MLRGFTLSLVAIFFYQVKVQFSISPNAFDANGKRTGQWSILYGNSWRETQIQDSALHYRLVRFEAGKPIGKVCDLYRNGTKQRYGYLLS